MDKRFSTTQTLVNGRSLTTTISWKNDWGSTIFLLDNKVHVNLDGTERKLDMAMEWGLSKLPDMDFSTPENGYFMMNAIGKNNRWGDFYINRDVSVASSNGKLTCDLTGNSKFTKGALASPTPIETLVKASFNVTNWDLEGVFKKVVAGKEYSITWPKGTFVIPLVKFGL